MRNELIAKLQKIAGQFPDKLTSAVFLINNYYMVKSILDEYSLASFIKEKKYFEQHLDICISEFVQVQLSSMIASMIKYVETVENDPKACNYGIFKLMRNNGKYFE